MKNVTPASASRNITEDHRTFGALLRFPYQVLASRVYARLAECGFPDIRPAHSAVFRHITPDGLRITELAERAHMTKQSMGALVEHLRERGYVVLGPDPDDGRARRVRLTDRGRAVQDRAMEISRDEEQALEALVGAETMRELRLRLETLCRALEDRAAKSPPPARNRG